ncbi:MAG: divergent PAP2 family protein [Clostridiales bacterium]|jgi:acid phosphatase family membrane protein YuiD|nr:divergent PAP2 family protein [Clostridiales bacterium]
MNIFKEFLENKVLWTSLLSWAIAQTLKVIIELARHKRIDSKLFVSTGGMPSSHSAFSSAMAAGVGLADGFNSSVFAVAAVISLVVMYDAAGIRRAAGKQAEILNMLIDYWENAGLKIDKRLKELLGHTPIEVAAGAILGIVTAIIVIK